MTTIFAFVLVGLLLAISWVDLRRQVIPDILNIGLAGVGAAFQASTAPRALPWQILAAVATFLMFWILRRVHAAAAGRIGLGLGDVKMAGAAAIWINPWNLPVFVFLASSVGLAALLARYMVIRRDVLRERQPFGPFLALSLLIIWMVERS